jgi:hypothetical protein
MSAAFKFGRALRHVALTLSATFAFAVPAHAATVLYYVDLNHFDYVTPALAAGGHTVTTATSWPDFNTKLAAGGYQLAIALNQNSSLGADLPTMTNYVNTGGRVIFTDWTRQASFATVLKGGYTGGTNQTSLNFLNPALSAGIVNPQPLTNPGWGTFSMSESTGPGGISVCTFPDASSCVVAGNNGRTLLLGFLADTPSATDGTRLWQNLIGYSLAAPALTQPVPTLSQWSLIALALVLVALASLRLRRRA